MPTAVAKTKVMKSKKKVRTENVQPQTDNLEATNLKSLKIKKKKSRTTEPVVECVETPVAPVVEKVKKSKKRKLEPVQDIAEENVVDLEPEVVAAEKAPKKKKKSHTKEVDEQPKESVETVAAPNTSASCEGFGLLPITDSITNLKQTNNKLFNKWSNKGKSEYTCQLPCKSVGRPYTVSLALPASILEETCLLEELRTFVIGQIARAACIYAVDEVIVFDDGCWNPKGKVSPEDLTGMMKTILEYQECPQYMRKYFFPMHQFTRKVGILNAMNAPHHLRATEWCTYREGYVTEELVNDKYSMVNVGLKSYVQIDQKVPPGMRVTVKFPPEGIDSRKPYGTVVSPKEPREKAGLYWGYSVRLAKSLSQVFVRDGEDKKYDLIIGTSENGQRTESLDFGEFKNALIVFGGVDGLEAAIKNDKSLTKASTDKIFDHYVNTCPYQQSRTIRTEEAILVTLSALSNKLRY